MESINVLCEVFRANYKGNVENLENVIEVLKNEGASMRDSTFVLATELQIPLTDADLIILNSKTWSEQKKITEELRTKIHEILSNL